MVVLHYNCLKLKMPGPWEVIAMASSMTEAYLYEQEGMTIASANVAATNLAKIQRRSQEGPLNSTKGSPTVTFA